MKPLAGARLTVINPAPTAPYTGMLPGYVAGHYERHELDIDLVRLARFADARLVLGAASGIDREQRTITVAGRPPIPYDVCSINVGITSAMPDLPGFAEHAVAAKPLGRFATRWSAFVQAPRATAPSVVVIGGGVGGVELALAMTHRLRENGESPTVTVIDSGEILGELSDLARTHLRQAITDAGVECVEHAQVTEVTQTGVKLLTGPEPAASELPADFVVGAAGARPFGWLSELGLAHVGGFLTVDKTLRSVSDPAIFAAGDCAHLGYAPRPKAGVFAVRQAPVLFDNLQASLANKKMRHYDPQDDYLKLISLGEKRAAADKFGRFVQGRSMWRLKDRIDQSFMRKLGELPDMDPVEVPKSSVAGLATTLEQEPPLCGGCGAKVGADILSGPLAELPTGQRSDVVRLPGDDAALLEFGATRQVITTDSLRAFTPDPFRMAKIAALHAMGDVWAMGADPQAVLVTVTLPQLGRSLQAEWLSEIMTGTSQALAESGAEIVGGHTSMGAELALGYSITGLVDGAAITLAGAQVGQKLILTRPLGSGILFAAEMAKLANGNDVAALLDQLEQPQGRAAAILADKGATAMTDVTGFGLAGHLFGMLRESQVGAALELDAIPVFAGALDLAAQGIRSHLHAANKVGVPLVASGPASRGDHPLVDTLFDPQTAGGFLAAVPAHHADEAIDELQAAGFASSAVIGAITHGPPALALH